MKCTLAFTFYLFAFINLGLCNNAESGNAPARRKPTAAPTNAVSIEKYGARANDPSFDNAPAIIRALQQNSRVLIPANKNFTIRSVIQVSGLTSRTLIATNGTIINRNYDARTFLFIDCSGITITGGLYTRDVMPKTQNGKEQSTIGFRNCKNVTVSNTHIKYSPEMGIDNNIVINGTYSYNTIEYCLRDGIYAHYSANLKYIGNVLSQIKDDALSMHDYGIDAQRTALHQAGYKQAGNSVITANKITGCVQGISSIGCKNLVISKNIIKNTVNAGITVFNSEDLYPNSDARVNNVKILNNTLTNTGITVSLNTLTINNRALAASGRAAIFVGCNRQGQAFTTSKMRSAQVVVSNNKVISSAVNGATLYNIDGLTVTNNQFINCHSDTQNDPDATGDIVEVMNCTGINVQNNQVIDSRKVVLHRNAYKLENSRGTFKKGLVKGIKAKDVVLDRFN